MLWRSICYGGQDSLGIARLNSQYIDYYPSFKLIYIFHFLIATNNVKQEKN